MSDSIAIPRTRTADLARRLDDATAAEVAILLNAVRKPPPPSERSAQREALSFAHARLSETAHPPSLSTFLALARERYGWGDEEFGEWALQRRWVVP